VSAPAVAAAKAALAKVAAYDEIQPQTWIRKVPPADVLAAAKAVDDDAPLSGLTFAVKDNIDVAGMPTTAACPAFAYTPEASAPVVERLVDAGAVLLGKTNMDQFATGLVGTRSPYGIPGCVFNRAYVSGGSSSGSAVAVAAGLVDFALGTDTAGSGRVPAAFNGLVGFKPTKGRWSTRGVIPACRSLDCVSVFTQNAGLAARIDGVLAHFDIEDPYSRRTEVRAAPGAIRYGIPHPDQLNFFGDLQAESLYREAAGRLPTAAAEIDISPLLEAARLLYSGPWVAERTAALKTLLAEQPDAIHPVVREIVEAGAKITAVEAFEGFYALAEYARAAEKVWERIDVLVLPTTGTIFRIREVLAAPVALNAALGAYTNFVNLLDLCAIALPAGYRDNGTGFGVTLMAPAWSDALLIDLAAKFEDPMEKPTLDTQGRPQTVKLCVVGAHLEGMPLHWQLTSRKARLVAKTRTAPTYRLYAIANSMPPKPALVFDETGGSLEVEVYELGVDDFGSFTVEVPPPLAIGTVTLEDGAQVKGFVAEPRALVGAKDITERGGWRAYIASLS
jgi:allophanate hydrolase